MLFVAIINIDFFNYRMFYYKKVINLKNKIKVKQKEKKRKNENKKKWTNSSGSRKIK